MPSLLRFLWTGPSLSLSPSLSQRKLAHLSAHASCIEEVRVSDGRARAQVAHQPLEEHHLRRGEIRVIFSTPHVQRRSRLQVRACAPYEACVRE